MHKIDILGVKFNTTNFTETVDHCLEIIEQDKRGYPIPVNVNIIMQMRSNEAVRKYVHGASVTVADGAPLVWLSRLWYRSPMPERVTGVDLMQALIEQSAKRGHEIYFLGATDEVMDLLLKRLRAEYPEIKIAGHSDGFFSEADEPRIVEEIAQSGAKVLFVCMGVPRQEEFVMRHWERLGVNLVLAGGGSFDLISGTKQRAPLVWRKYCLEWLYRLLEDPKRYIWRYIETFPLFISLAFIASLYRIPRRLLVAQTTGLEVRNNSDRD